MDCEFLLPLIEKAGAVKFGIAPLEPVAPDEFARYERWLAEGHHGSMAYLANHLAIRRNPALLLSTSSDATVPSEGSILSFAFPYFSGNPYREGRLRFARYSLGDDYHDVLRTRLRPVADAITEATGCQARICVDTAPIMERYWAVRAGLGYIGKNHQLIIPGIGSHVFLAEIVTGATFSGNLHESFERTEGDRRVLPLQSSTVRENSSCLNCGRCLRACPMGALTDNDFDGRRCLSYLTIEHRRELPPDLTLSNGRVYGCDLCLEACPLALPLHSEEDGIFPLPEFQPRDEILNLTAAKLESLTPEEYSLIFRHSPVKRAKLAGLRRNLAVLQRGKKI